MGSPFAENEFHAPGVELVMVNACKGVFNQFIANYRVLGWRLTITSGPHDGWTAEIVDPDGVSVESRLPNAIGAAMPLKGFLEDQCRKYSAKHSPPPMMR
jgi:hypothetical protein